jgi:hypothetical protein
VIVEYNVTIYQKREGMLPTNSNVIKTVVNGLGETVDSARKDAQKQIRALIRKHLTYVMRPKGGAR